MHHLTLTLSVLCALSNQCLSSFKWNLKKKVEVKVIDRVKVKMHYSNSGAVTVILPRLNT